LKSPQNDCKDVLAQALLKPNVVKMEKSKSRATKIFLEALEKRKIPGLEAGLLRPLPAGVFIKGAEGEIQGFDSKSTQDE